MIHVRTTGAFPLGLLDGKTGLVVGIANDRSYAWHIAKAVVACFRGGLRLAQR